MLHHHPINSLFSTPGASFHKDHTSRVPRKPDGLFSNVSKIDHSFDGLFSNVSKIDHSFPIAVLTLDILVSNVASFF